MITLSLLGKLALAMVLSFTVPAVLFSSALLLWLKSQQRACLIMIVGSAK